MTAVLPTGDVTLLGAAETLSPAMYAGVPDLPIVTSLRQEGIDVRDGPAMDRAVAELWKAVDEGSLRPMAIGGTTSASRAARRRDHKQIPTLRNPRGRGFTFLRQRAWLGTVVAAATVGSGFLWCEEPRMEGYAPGLFFRSLHEWSSGNVAPHEETNP